MKFSLAFFVAVLSHFFVRQIPHYLVHLYILNLFPICVVLAAIHDGLMMLYSAMSTVICSAPNSLSS